MSKKGILIAVEGMDGSGKSTQAKLLYHWLRAKGLPVFHTEWNSSKIVKQATKIGKNTRRLLPITFHMIHAADFADRWAQQIEPVLEIGGIVICDRYKYTAMARDGSRDVPGRSSRTHTHSRGSQTLPCTSTSQWTSASTASPRADRA